MATKTRKTRARLSDELARRDDCRYGLAGLLCEVAGEAGAYRIYSTDWLPDDTLGLNLYPADGPKPRALWANEPEVIGPFELRNIADYIGLEEPPGFLKRVRAGRIVLLEPWPVVCCRPKRRRSAQ